MAHSSDPYLLRLRSLARTLPHRQAHEAETARFAVFSAIQAGRIDEALVWLETLRVAVLAAASAGEVPPAILDATQESVEGVKRTLKGEGR